MLKDNQQCFPHSVINTISAFELFHELSLAFTRPENTTNRFLLFTCQQKEDKSYRTHIVNSKALGVGCHLRTAEDELSNELFIAFMNVSENEREVLMDTKTPLQVQQIALN